MTLEKFKEEEGKSMRQTSENNEIGSYPYMELATQARNAQAKRS